MEKKTEKTKEQKTSEQIRDEIMNLSKRADETTNHQMDLFKNQKFEDDDIDIGFDASILNDTADPQKSYKLYYGMRGMLMDALPTGKKHKKLRQYVYDEKNLFLKHGFETGADGRMAFINNFLIVAFNVVAKWIASGGTSYDLYMEFWNLNEERGYHASPVSQPDSEFDVKLKAILTVPKPPKKDK